ncbi:MAG TPA: antibiotic biosynthesis monooxygenase [Candidatus Acidoferrum sp.]
MTERIYRVDKFAVPIAAREEFVDKARRTHALLKEQPGFLQDFVLEQSSGPGEFNFVTIVEWASQEAVENARAAILALHREMNFNPQEMLARFGIKADVANYKRL